MSHTSEFEIESVEEEDTPKVEMSILEELGTVSKGLSRKKAMFLVFRSLVGIGILTMPHQINSIGIVGAAIFYPTIAVMVLYALDLMVRTADDLEYYDQSLEGLALRTCGPTMAWIIKLLNNWMIFATGIANVIFAVKFLKFAFCNLHVDSICSNELYIHIIAYLLSLPFCFIGEIGFFVASSLIATFFILTCVITVAVYCALYWSTHGESSTTQMMDLNYFGEFFGVVCFSIEGIGLMLPIRASLKKREGFRKLFNSVCGGVIAFYFIYGTIGALAFGKGAHDIILFNFGKESPLIYPQSLLYAIGIFVSFPYILFPLAPSLRESNLVKKCMGVGGYWRDVFLRVFLVSICFGISLTGINLIDFINFSGGLFNAILAFIFPIHIYVKHFSKKGKISKNSRIFHYGLMTLGLIFALISNYSAIGNIIRGHQNGK